MLFSALSPQLRIDERHYSDGALNSTRDSRSWPPVHEVNHAHRHQGDRLLDKARESFRDNYVPDYFKDARSTAVAFPFSWPFCWSWQLQRPADSLQMFGASALSASNKTLRKRGAHVIFLSLLEVAMYFAANRLVLLLCLILTFAFAACSKVDQSGGKNTEIAVRMRDPQEGTKPAAVNEPKSPVLQNLQDVGALAVIVLGVIVLFVLVYRYSGSLAYVGVLIGLILGAATILSIPLEVQYAILGGILGVGGDFATSKSKGKPNTMIEAVSTFIVKATTAAANAASEAELEHEKRRVSFLIWSAIGTLALMLIVGRILNGMHLATILVKAH